MAPPTTALPLQDEWNGDVDSYVNHLLSFATSNNLFIQLCGGVHILDFLTREPDLYTDLLPQEWRDFFDLHDVQTILQLLLREDLSQLPSPDTSAKEAFKWRNGPVPPSSLVDYIRSIRRLSLRRDFRRPESQPTFPSRKGEKRRAGSSLPYVLAQGMNTKKVHEVENFSAYVARLADEVATSRNGEQVSHIVDFGSGQNYLGRTLASPPFNKHVIAIERKHDLVQGANVMDVRAKLVAKKEIRLVNKKELRSKRQEVVGDKKDHAMVDPIIENASSSLPQLNGTVAEDAAEEADAGTAEDVQSIDPILSELQLDKNDFVFSQIRKQDSSSATKEARLTDGLMDYIEHEIKDGYLEPIIRHVVESPPTSDEETLCGGNDEQATNSLSNDQAKPQVMVISLHSCGNLVHHGVRSLVLNPSVVAVAMIGCCYNLMTERLGPPTFKLPLLSFRSAHPRLETQSDAYDPHGFPMSKTLENYIHPVPDKAKTTNSPIVGIKFNITARMMAVQAPYNWGRDDSEGFFTRHFYRALLQRILRDREVVPKPRNHSFATQSPSPGSSSSPNNDSSSDDFNGASGGTPLIVGSLRKSAFVSFPAYARAAIHRLSRDPVHGAKIVEKVGTEEVLTTQQLEWYAEHYAPSRKRLSIVWSLMAFSAGVVEAIIVVDRWLFLREQECVQECWVEPVFDYAASPRNLAVIGIKKA